MVFCVCARSKCSTPMPNPLSCNSNSRHQLTWYSTRNSGFPSQKVNIWMAKSQTQNVWLIDKANKYACDKGIRVLSIVWIMYFICSSYSYSNNVQSKVQMRWCPWIMRQTSLSLAADAERGVPCEHSNISRPRAMYGSPLSSHWMECPKIRRSRSV